MANVKSRIAKMEGHVKSTPRLGMSQFFLELLNGGKEFEMSLEAAFFLSFDNILERPSDSLWQRLEGRYDYDQVEQWTQTQHWFAAARSNREHQEFADDEGKEGLLEIALTYFWVYDCAPKVEDKRQQVLARDRLNHLYLVPLIEAACPQIKGYSYATHTAWLAAVPDSNSSDYRPASLLHSLRDYTAELRSKSA